MDRNIGLAGHVERVFFFFFALAFFRLSLFRFSCEVAACMHAHDISEPSQLPSQVIRVYP